MREPVEQPLATRFLTGVFGLVFLGIGLTVLGFLWFGGDAFGGPPLVFRLFGSFVAIAFVAMGRAMASSGLFGGRMMRTPTDPGGRPSANTAAAPVTGYSCPHCGAAPGDKADISPMGDCKCAFCGRWFNIHAQG